MVELILVLTIVGITFAISVGRIHDMMIQQRIARAATAVQNDLEGAFALASRNRRPIRISWNSATMQLDVTDRAGTMAYRHTSLGQAYGMKASTVSFSSSPVEVYPNGMSNQPLTITLSQESVTKNVRMSRTGMVVIR